MAKPDPGSFRDPRSRVFLTGNRVIRAVAASESDLSDLLATQFVVKGIESGDIVQSQLIRDVDGMEAQQFGIEWHSLVEHERLPVISYPFEWSRSMLADAAELELRVASAALSNGWSTIDATPYNVQFDGSRPVHIDLGSFEPYVEGRVWIAHRQFCEMYLHPLLMGSGGNGSEHRVLLRGSLGGISASLCWPRLSSAQRLNPSISLRVGLQAVAERRGKRSTSLFKHADLEDAGFTARVIDKQIQGLQKLIARYRGPSSSSQWSNYSDRTHYLPSELKKKTDFVIEVAASMRPSQILDIGTNDGVFAKAAAPYADLVVAIDNDDAVVDSLYLSLRESGRNILPLVIDITDPAGGRGWANVERPPFLQRVSPDLVLCLAVVHHLVISASIPPEMVVSFLRSLDAEVILEIPSIDDPMVNLLLEQKANAVDYRHRYDASRLSRALDLEFMTRRRVEIGTRSLLHLIPRSVTQIS